MRKVLFSLLLASTMATPALAADRPGRDHSDRDQARSLASSLQSSWRRSQQDDNFPGPRPGPGSEEAS